VACFYEEYVDRLWPAVEAAFTKAADVKAQLEAEAAAAAAAAAIAAADSNQAGGVADGRRASSSAGRRSTSAGRAQSAISDALNATKGSPIPPYGLFDVSLFGEESERAVVAIAQAVLPPPKISLAELAMMLPAPQDFQVVRRPYPRMARRPVQNFRLLASDDDSVSRAMTAFEATFAGAVVAEAPTAPPTKGGKAAPKGKEPAAAVAPVVATSPDDPPAFYDDGQTRFVSRWVVEPFASVQFKVRFRSLKEGRFDSSLVFEVVGTSQTLTLFCQGNCEVPKISPDPRNIFMRRVKAMPLAPLPPPAKRFCTAENMYSFGPLQLFKKASWRPTAAGAAAPEAASPAPQGGKAAKGAKGAAGGGPPPPRRRRVPKSWRRWRSKCRPTATPSA